eukprot:3778633-Amphidinium_carterae.1
MRNRTLPLLSTEPLARKYATHKFIDRCMLVSKRLAHFASASAVAFAHLLLQGVPEHRSNVCCWRGESHSGHFLVVGLARGCYRRQLRDLRAFAFLKHAEPAL